MCGCEGLDDESAEDKLARERRNSTVLTRVINRLEEELRRERAAHRRTFTAVFEECFDECDSLMLREIICEIMLRLADKLREEGQSDEAKLLADIVHARTRTVPSAASCDMAGAA